MDKTMLLLLVGGVLSLVILYFIIKGAVEAANKKSERHQKILINLMGELLKQKGYSDEQIAGIVARVKAA